MRENSRSRNAVSERRAWRSSGSGSDWWSGLRESAAQTLAAGVATLRQRLLALSTVGDRSSSDDAPRGADDETVAAAVAEEVGPTPSTDRPERSSRSGTAADDETVAAAVAAVSDGPDSSRVSRRDPSSPIATSGHGSPRLGDSAHTESPGASDDEVAAAVAEL